MSPHADPLAFEDAVTDHMEALLAIDPEYYERFSEEKLRRLAIEDLEASAEDHAISMAEDRHRYMD